MSYDMLEASMKYARNSLGYLDPLPLLTAQLPRSVSMLIKSFQVLYYVFLVVPSLDFML